MKGTLIGANRRRLDVIFLSLGGRINRVRRHGELRYEHPRFARPIKIKASRKDTPRLLARAVIRLSEQA
jgi:hypothetical protein